MRNNRAAFAVSILAATMIVLAACSGGPTGPSGPHDGAYLLSSIDGVPVGPNILKADTAYKLSYGSFTIRGVTFDAWTNWFVTAGGKETWLDRHCAGTFTVRGTELRFTEAAEAGTTCGHDYVATWNRASETMTVATSQVFDIGVPLDPSSSAVYTRSSGVNYPCC